MSDFDIEFLKVTPYETIHGSLTRLKGQFNGVLPMKLEPVFSGDAYGDGKKLREIPKTLREATALLDGSKFLRSVMGDEVVDHYVHTAKWEQFEFDRRITDLELKRGFERY